MGCVDSLLPNANRVFLSAQHADVLAPLANGEYDDRLDTLATHPGSIAFAAEVDA